MIITICSNASYIPKTQACSRYGGHLFLTNKPKRGQQIINNGAVHVISAIICHVMSSTSKDKVAEFFINAKVGIILQNDLKVFGQPQPAMPLIIDSSTEELISNVSMVQNHSKAMDMRFYWLPYQESQK